MCFFLLQAAKIESANEAKTQVFFTQKAFIAFSVDHFYAHLYLY
jgi:hypothetical protein